MYDKKGSPYSITKHRVPELISVLGSQPAGDVSHKHCGRLSLRSAWPAVTLATLKSAATNLAAWWTEARWVWTVYLRPLPDSIAAAIWTVPSAPESSTLTTQLQSHPYVRYRPANGGPAKAPMPWNNRTRPKALDSFSSPSRSTRTIGIRQTDTPVYKYTQLVTNRPCCLNVLHSEHTKGSKKKLRSLATSSKATGQQQASWWMPLSRCTHTHTPV